MNTKKGSSAVLENPIGNGEDLNSIEEDDMLPDYSGLLKNGVRGKFLRQKAVEISVSLDPDVAAAYPTSEAVNAALRKLMQIEQPV